jgi:hypothetical protein
LSPDSSGKPFEVENLFLLLKISDPRSFFGAYKNGLKQKSLQRIAGLAPNNLLKIAKSDDLTPLLA